MSKSSPLSYRPDIDGLRAIAVMAVLLFHANIQAVKGGFVGVDIFFVISGFLITSILMKDLSKKPFSFMEYIAEFYERRARRIFPALFAVFTATTIAAWFILFPSELQDYGASLSSATLFFSNMFFLTQQNYFAAPSETMPLLHTWSLAVEEQFYIFFPLVLLAIAKWGQGRYRSYVTLLLIATLALSVALVQLWMPGAFFIALPRAYELLIGSLLALGTFQNIGQGRRVREVLAIMGLALMAYPIFTFHKGTHFPGFAALLPCVGAALIIHSGYNSRGQAPTLVARLLSLKPVVFIGLISYSLYLWHAPILVLCKIALTQNMPRMEKVCILLLCFVVATLSWRFIEKPFRNRNFLTRKQIFAITGSLMAVFSIIGGVFYFSGGVSSRYPENVRAMAAFTTYDASIDSRDGKCFLSSTFNDINLFDHQTCLARSSTQPNWLLMGDSHASHLYQGLKLGYPQANIQQATSSGCKPVLEGQGTLRCRMLRDEMFKSFIPSGGTDAIFLSARWNKSDIPLLINTINYLKQFNKPVYILGPIVEYPVALPRLLALSLLKPTGNLPLQDREGGGPIRDLDRTIQAALKDTPATYISTYRTLCPEDDKPCTTVVSGSIPTQFDYGHLTRAGALWVTSQWKPILTSATTLVPGQVVSPVTP